MQFQWAAQGTLRGLLEMACRCSNRMRCPGLSAPSSVSRWREPPRKEASSETTWKRPTRGRGCLQRSESWGVRPSAPKEDASSISPSTRASRQKRPLGAHLSIQNTFLASIQRAWRWSMMTDEFSVFEHRTREIYIHSLSEILCEARLCQGLACPFYR